MRKSLYVIIAAAVSAVLLSGKLAHAGAYPSGDEPYTLNWDYYPQINSQGAGGGIGSNTNGMTPAPSTSIPKPTCIIRAAARCCAAEADGPLARDPNLTDLGADFA